MPRAPKTDRLEDFHTRTFEKSALVPPFRAINPRRVEAALLNALLEVEPPENEPKRVLDMTLRNVAGDAATLAEVKGVLESVWFRPNRGTMGRSGQELLITHISMGRYFRPTHHYAVGKWVPAILHHGGVTTSPEHAAALKRVFESAQQRRRNLIEDCICGALTESMIGSAPQETPPAVAMPQLVHSVGRLVRNLLQQAPTKGLEQVEAERIALDILSLLRTAIYILWIQFHVNAYDALNALRDGREPPTRSRKFKFGFETERRAPRSRAFWSTRDAIELPFEEGDYAMMALSQAHTLFAFERPTWFNHLPERDLTSDESTAVKNWIQDYCKAANALDPVRLPTPWMPPPPTTVRTAVVAMFDTMVRNHKVLRPTPNTRSQYNVTVGAIGNMAQVDDGVLFSQLGPGRGMGIHAMVDTQLILLLSRAVMGENKRAHFLRVISELEEWGVTFDDDSQDEIIRELERRGHLQKLSDSGESIYVRVD